MKMGRIATYIATLALTISYLPGCNYILKKPTGFGGDVGGIFRPCDTECEKSASFRASDEAFTKRYGRFPTIDDIMDYVPHERPCGICPERPVPQPPKN